jgi:hypothetical protein
MNNTIAYHPELEKVVVVDVEANNHLGSLKQKGFQFYRVENNGQAVALVPLRSNPSTEVSETRVVSVTLEDA